EEIASRACRDFAGPAGGEGNPDAALIQHGLFAAKFHTGARILVSQVNAARVLLRREVIVGAIVAAEKDKRVLVDCQLLEQFEDLTNLAVEHGHHSRITPRG